MYTASSIDVYESSFIRGDLTMTNACFVKNNPPFPTKARLFYLLDYVTYRSEKSSKITENNYDFKTLVGFGKLHVRKIYDRICTSCLFSFALADLKKCIWCNIIPFLKVKKKRVKVFYLYSTFPWIFHCNKGALQSHLAPGSGLSLCHSFMRRSHPLSDQLPGEHTGQGVLYLGFPVSAMNLFGMHIFCKLQSSARYSFLIQG